MSTELWTACRHNDLGAVISLVSNDTPIDYSSVRIAIHNGNMEIFKYLVNNSDVIQPNDPRILLAAITSYRIEFVKYSIDNGVDVNHRDDSPIRSALMNNYLDIARYLLSHGANILNDGINSLYTAAQYDAISTIDLLIEHGVDARLVIFFPMIGVVSMKHLLNHVSLVETDFNVDSDIYKLLESSDHNEALFEKIKKGIASRQFVRRRMINNVKHSDLIIACID